MALWAENPHGPMKLKPRIVNLLQRVEPTLPKPLALALVKHDRERRIAAGASGHTAQVLAERNWDIAKREASAAIPMKQTVLHPPPADRLQKEQLRSVVFPSLTLAAIPVVYSPARFKTLAIAAVGLNAAVQLSSATCDSLQALAWRSLARTDPDALWK
jgi:hypothetical protein